MCGNAKRNRGGSVWGLRSNEEICHEGENEVIAIRLADNACRSCHLDFSAVVGVDETRKDIKVFVFVQHPSACKRGTVPAQLANARASVRTKLLRDTARSARILGFGPRHWHL